MLQKINWSAISPDESEKLKNELVEVWEASVRSTHRFLTEKDIRFFKPLVRNKYIPVVELYIIRNGQNRIAAFMGLSDELIEMLFVMEHQMKYKRNIKHETTIRQELKRCADEIASVDVSMQTIRDILRSEEWE